MKRPNTPKRSINIEAYQAAKKRIRKKLAGQTFTKVDKKSVSVWVRFGITKQRSKQAILDLNTVIKNDISLQAAIKFLSQHPDAKGFHVRHLEYGKRLILDKKGNLVVYERQSYFPFIKLNVGHLIVNELTFQNIATELDDLKVKFSKGTLKVDLSKDKTPSIKIWQWYL